MAGYFMGTGYRIADYCSVNLLSASGIFGYSKFPAWMGVAYVALFSMFIGFIFWYKGLAQEGIAASGQAAAIATIFLHWR